MFIFYLEIKYFKRNKIQKYFKYFKRKDNFLSFKSSMKDAKCD